MNFDEFASRFKNAKRNRQGYTALCPAHDDKSRSLSIGVGEGGKILLKCFAGCLTDAIVTAVGLEMKDLFPDNDHSPVTQFDVTESCRLAKASTMRTVIAAVHRYTDADGETLYENVRYDPKDFRQRRPDGNGGYIYNLVGVDRVPYRLPDLIAAIKSSDAEIYFTEGEKDADNLRTLGFTATSFKNWSQELNRYIEGCKAVLFVDHDRPGLNHANAAATIIADVAKSIQVIDIYGHDPLLDKHGKDITDWIDDRRGEGLEDADIAKRLSAIVAGEEITGTTQLPIRGQRSNGPFQFRFSTVDELCSEPEEETDYVWDRTLPVGGFSIISSKPKVGKSTVLRNLALAISRGSQFLARETRKGKVLYLCLEEKRSEVGKHFRVLGADGDSILIHSGSSPKTTEEAITAMKAAIAKYDPAIIFVDPLSRVLRTPDFNDYARITRELEPFIDLARESNVHICALHHDGKVDRTGGDAILGSTAFFGAVDCHLSMKKRGETRTISSTQRYGETLPETVIELDETTGLIIDLGEYELGVMEVAKTEILRIISSRKITQTELKDRLRHRNGGVVSKSLSALQSEGILARSGSGRRGSPYVYWVRDTGEATAAGNH